MSVLCISASGRVKPQHRLCNSDTKMQLASTEVIIYFVPISAKCLKIGKKCNALKIQEVFQGYFWPLTGTRWVRSRLRP
jgi:hypothetical protein